MKRFYIPLVLILCPSFSASAANEDDLTGTSWQLVSIQSMDDSVDVPENAPRYTLEFLSDGTASIHADCNRGSGSWSSEASSGLSFGPIASTRAMCPPGSLSDKYLSQFEWVRSYLMKDGHLFLATMADGSIIEFEPAATESATATVLGETLHTTDANELQETILTRLFDNYAEEHNVKVEPAEVDALIETLHEGKAEAGLNDEEDLTQEEAAEIKTVETEFATSMVRQWKINKALYEQYGGRIVYQQLGLEPLDAYRKFLELSEKEGAFTINQLAMANVFWDYFKNDTLHDFVKPESNDEANAFEKAPWEKSP